MEEKMTTEEKTAKVRTSITIDPGVLEAARSYCVANRLSVSSFIEEALRDVLGLKSARVNTAEVELVQAG